MTKPEGWRKDSKEHALAAKGIESRSKLDSDLPQPQEKPFVLSHKMRRKIVESLHYFKADEKKGSEEYAEFANWLDEKIKLHHLKGEDEYLLREMAAEFRRMSQTEYDHKGMIEMMMAQLGG